MTAPASALAPIQLSPLKVTDKDRQLIAQDANGATVLRGTRGENGAAEMIVLETAGGTWRVQRAVDKLSDVLDRNGQPVAKLHRRAFRSTLIELPGGESIPVSTGTLRIFGIGCKVGDLASARAPYFFPQRYFKLTLREALMQRPDRDLIVALGTSIANTMIIAQIAAAASSPSP